MSNKGKHESRILPSENARFSLCLESELVQEIEAYREGLKKSLGGGLELPRSEVIRLLLRRGLDAEKKVKRSKRAA